MFYRAHVVMTLKQTIANSIETVTSFCSHSAHDLRLWLLNSHNGLCQTFELLLPEWRARGSSIRIKLELCQLQIIMLVGTALETMVGPDVVVQCEQDRDVAVQCEQCQKWFTLPPDLLDIFKCTLRW